MQETLGIISLIALVVIDLVIRIVGYKQTRK